MEDKLLPATSWQSKFPTCGPAISLKTALGVLEVKDAAGLREARRLLAEELGGIAAMLEELKSEGFVESDGRLSTNPEAGNVFARFAVGALVQPGMEKEQAFLGEYQDRFFICSNKPASDEHWDSEDPEWVGKASMSRHHRFLTTRDLHWQWFNALLFGLVPPEDGGAGLSKAVDEVEAMEIAALAYAKASGHYSSNVGLFVHVFGNNSVNSLHIHIVDLDSVGPAFKHNARKNCPLGAVLDVMRQELLQDVPGSPARAVPPLRRHTRELRLEEPEQEPMEFLRPMHRATIQGLPSRSGMQAEAADAIRVP